MCYNFFVWDQNHITGLESFITHVSKAFKLAVQAAGLGKSFCSPVFLTFSVISRMSCHRVEAKPSINKKLFQTCEYFPVLLPVSLQDSMLFVAAFSTSSRSSERTFVLFFH